VLRKIPIVLAAVALGLVALAAPAVAGTAPSQQGQAVEAQGDVGVLSCYGSAKSYSKPSGEVDYPPGAGLLTSTSNCADINIKPNTTRSVRVCFAPSSGAWYCQPSYRTATAGQWTVVATAVLDNTKFWFNFASTAASSGQYAA
jgi:hypothetical protein